MIIIDFDDTLFDTQHFIRDICEVLVAHGVSSDDARETMKSSILNKGTRTYNYTFEHHLGQLGRLGYEVHTQDVLQQLFALTAKKDYSFEDALPFLQRLKALQHRMILLSAGNEAFQRMKFESTQFAPFFDEVVIVPSKKEEYVVSLDLDKDALVFFINDKSPENEAVKEHRPDTIVITKHNPYKAVGDFAPTMSLPTFDSLLEIATYVETYSK